tara:strand:+ start:2046 stop:3764 length:1719 start_codon:yes stop_codon:yes gene_type:complete
MRNIFFFLNLQKKTKIIFILFLLLLGTSLDLFGLSIIIPTMKIISDYNYVNEIINNYSLFKPLGNLSQNELIILFLLIFLLINILKGLVFIFLNWKTNVFSKELNQQISKSLIEYYSTISYEEMIHKSSSTLIRNITQEVEGVSGAVMNFLSMIVELFIMICIFIFILYIEPGGISIISFVLLLGLYIYRKVLVKKMIKWGYERQSFYLKKIQNINEIFHSYSELKILNKINFFGRYYIKFNEIYFNNIIKYTVTQIVPRFLVETLAVIGVVIALIYLIIIQGDQEQILYSLAILGASALRILPSINRVINYYNSFKFSDASLNLIKNEFSKLEKYKSNKLKNDYVLNFSNKIEIKNINYKYPNKEINILKNVNLEILKNDIVGIKGKTGSGKSTLLKIILGLLKPTDGTISVDNKDINKNNQLASWFDKIAYVPQEIYLLNDSVKKNILFGVDESKINQNLYNLSINSSQCTEFIKDLEQKDNTFVGENGIKMSGGQKQRIGLARAIYLKREVLVLDEATNSLDELTEKKIIDDILKMPNRPTIIFVSHRSANFGICNKIFDMSNMSFEIR